jgi:hypothetical protein
MRKIEARAYDTLTEAAKAAAAEIRRRGIRALAVHLKVAPGSVSNVLAKLEKHPAEMTLYQWHTYCRPLGIALVAVATVPTWETSAAVPTE